MTNDLQLKGHLSKLASGGLCVVLSGGAGSAVILKAAREVCENVLAVTVQTPFCPPRDTRPEEKTARELGARFELIKIEKFSGEIMQNPPDRCYLCHKAVFGGIISLAEQNGLRTVLDCAAADGAECRSGLKALAELGVKSPLKELGLTGAQARYIAGDYGLAPMIKPPPCLATRIPCGTRIEPDVLRKIGEIETHMKLRGFPVARAVIHGDVVRIEVPSSEFEGVLDYRDEIVKTAKNLGFNFVTLDLAGLRP